MPYTVIQTDNIAITPRQLASALAVTARYAPADGVKMAREMFGLIVDRLSREEADRMQQVLHAEGVATAVIDDADLFAMPPVKTVKRIDCLKEHLVVYDALGRPKALTWGQVLVVVAGRVNLFETQVNEQSRWEPNGLAAGRAPLPVPVTRRSLEGQEVPRLVLDIIVMGDPSRYRAEAHELSYAYLGDRQRGSVDGNFEALATDMLGFASLAVFNQGAVALASDFDGAFTYPSRKSFEREIVWLVWWASRQA